MFWALIRSSSLNASLNIAAMKHPTNIRKGSNHAADDYGTKNMNDEETEKLSCGGHNSGYKIQESGHRCVTQIRLEITYVVYLWRK